MTEVWIRVCYLCNQKGELKFATHTYRTPNDDDYDVCEDCAKLCKAQGLDVWEIIGETEEER